MEKLTDSGIFGFRINEYEDQRGRSSSLPDSVLNGFMPKQFLNVANIKSGTLRGLHYQNSPYRESKILVCLAGSIFDVLVNLNSLEENDPEVFTISLGNAHDFQGLVIPDFYAHGYLTMNENVQLAYLINKPYVADFSNGLRWSDPKLNITWPGEINLVSERDSSWPYL
jgi:dTDP-4-dehydrorhamnose 3,5-epimerase